MWSINSATKIYLARGVTDMRKSFHGLHAWVDQVLKRDPVSGHWFIFCNRRRNRLKIFFWDGSGFWVCAKRLEKGRFSWWREDEEKLELDAQQLAMLVGGYEFDKIRRKKWYFA
jgi:transposase